MTSVWGNYLGRIGILILAFLIVLMVLPFFLSWGPTEFDPDIIGTHWPTLSHPLGTDAYGRDILVRLCIGVRNAFMHAIIASASATTIGTAMGLIAGYFGGVIDNLIDGAIHVILCIPMIILLIVLSSVFGGMSTWHVIILLILLSWVATARVIRSLGMSLREREYVQAARSYGASDMRIIFRHLLPAVLPLSVIYMCFKIRGVISIIAALAFIGLGDPTTISLGMMFKNCSSQGYIFSAPYWTLPPGIAISLICLGFYLVGRAISDKKANVKLEEG